MKRLTVLILIISLFSCNKKKAGNDDIQSLYESSTQEIVEYANFYEQDSLLVKAEVTYVRDGQPREKESRFFEYNNNGQLIEEKYFLHKEDSMNLIYEKKIGENTKDIIEIRDNDTSTIDQSIYDNKGNLMHHKYKSKTGHIQMNYEYFDYEYDNQNRLIQEKFVNLDTSDSSITQYEYDTQGDTIVKYSITNGDVSSIEKTITNRGIFEHYSYILPEFKLDYYEKKIMTDENNYIKIEESVGLYVDSIFVEEGRKVKYINVFEGLMFTYIYEYDSLNNLKKEIHYTKYLE